MRTNTDITQTEKDAYTAFCLKHRILQDGSEAGVANANHIGNYVALTWGEDLTEATLQVALEQLKDRLTFISPQQAEVTEVLRKLDQGQRDIVATWLGKQRWLETEADQGFSNVAMVVAWLLNRRYAVSEAGLDMALGNVQNNSKRKLFWKETPKESREYVQGRPNHAFGQEEPKPKAAAVGVQQEYINGRKNHAYTPPGETAKTVAAQAPDAWKEICQLYLKEWITAGQRVKLEGEYNAGIASGKSWRDIATSLADIIRDQQRGR
jgi:hypothetical protein